MSHPPGTASAGGVPVLSGACRVPPAALGRWQGTWAAWGAVRGSGLPGAVPRAGEPGLALGDACAADPAAAGGTGLRRGVPAKVAISALAVGAQAGRGGHLGSPWPAGR